MTSQRRPNSTPTKMDSAKALSIMGFTSTRWMDASTGMDPKEALDKALSDQMLTISLKKKGAARDRKESEKGYGEHSGRTARAKILEEKCGEEFRILHEAYQYLLRKYNGSNRMRSLEASVLDEGPKAEVLRSVEKKVRRNRVKFAAKVEPDDDNIGGIYAEGRHLDLFCHYDDDDDADDSDF